MPFVSTMKTQFATPKLHLAILVHDHINCFALKFCKGSPSLVIKSSRKNSREIKCIGSLAEIGTVPLHRLFNRKLTAERDFHLKAVHAL